VSRLAGLRAAVRGARDPLTPPRRLRALVGPGDFNAIGDEFMGHFVELGGLRPEHDVLDVGCGAGRMARPLAGWLEGRYEGFDVVPEAIEWCRREIASRHPGFGFALADVRNSEYNPSGGRAPDEYRFPYDDESFDFAFATSVFTHLLPPAADRYLAEVARVLRPGGACLATWFLLDPGAERRTPEARRLVDRGDHLVTDGEAPEAAVAYAEGWLRERHARHGLPIERIYYGSWNGREHRTSYQDLAVARRA
jgi:SAM-dependent methyltransferase